MLKYKLIQGFSEEDALFEETEENGNVRYATIQGKQKLIQMYQKEIQRLKEQIKQMKDVLKGSG